MAASAAAWAVVLIQAREGLSVRQDLLPFTVAWTAMMAAMMLPSVAPVAALYARSLGTQRLRLISFTTGYLAVWAATSVPAFTIAALDTLVRAAWVRPLAAGAFLLAAAYQLTPLKALCLEHCRSPLSLLLEYARYKGPLRDLRAGAHHGLYCLGCCWPLMLLLPVVGMMNILAALVLAAFVVLEKNLARGVVVSRAAAAVTALLGFASFVLPQLSAGVGSAPM